MLLGDAYISKPRPAIGRRGGTLEITHTVRHREYLEYKRDLLQHWQHTPLVIREKVNTAGRQQVRLSTRQRPLYRLLQKAFYKGGQRTVSPKLLGYLDRRAIAIWFMDDGSLSAKKKDGRIKAFDLTLCTCLPVEQNLLIIDYFREVWGVEWKLLKQRSHYMLRMGTKEGRKWARLIEPECVVECMRYKINPLLV